MAKSIKLGADTYLDASGVAMDGTGNTLGGGLSVKNVSISSQMTDTTLLAALNDNNTSIPDKVLTLLVVTGINGQSALILVNKTNNNYGRAKAVSYYSSSEYLLDSGTWVSDTANTTFTNNGITFYMAKKNGICTLSALSGGLTSAVSANTAFATIPSGWRPKIGCEVMESSGGKRMSIGTSGAIQFSSAQTAGTYVRFTVTYVLA